MAETNLAGRIAVITGGARGLGYAVAETIAARGADIVLFDILEQVHAAAVALAASSGRRVAGLTCDVTDEASIGSALDTATEALGATPTLLVNSAGIALGTPALATTTADWNRVIGVNLTGTFLTCREFAIRVIASGSRAAIVNFASMSGHVVNVPQTQVAYNTSKAGVSMLTKSLAVEWIHHGIRVNSISPGYFLSDMTKDFAADHPQMRAEWEARIPLGRMGEPTELGDLVVYLLSDSASYLVGHDVVIDGGYTLV